MKYTNCQIGIKGSCWDLVWIVKRRGKLSGMLEEEW